MRASLICNYVNWGHHWFQHKKTGPVPMIYKSFWVSLWIYNFLSVVSVSVTHRLLKPYDYTRSLWLILNVNIVSNMFIILLKGSFFLRGQTCNSAVCSKQSSWFCHCCWNGCQVSDNVFVLSWCWTTDKWYWDVYANHPTTGTVVQHKLTLVSKIQYAS